MTEEDNCLIPSRNVDSAILVKPKEGPTEKEVVLTTYYALRGALHSAASWHASEQATLTCCPTGAGFTGQTGMHNFTATLPTHPLDAAYLHRFNNACTTIHLACDVEQAVISETLVLRTMFQPAWKWMLPVGCFELASQSVTFTMTLSVKMAGSKLMDLLIQWDAVSLWHQLGLFKLDGLVEPLHMAARLSKPTPRNAIQCASNTSSADASRPNEPKQRFNMIDLLTDLPPPTPQNTNKNGSRLVSSHPAFTSRKEELFVGQQALEMPITPTRINPMMQTNLVLGDGTDEHDDRKGVAKNSTTSGPMGTLLDEPVIPMPSRGCNKCIQADLFGHSSENTQAKEFLRPDNARFASSVFKPEDDIPIQSINNTEDKALADKSRFSSHIFDALSVPDSTARPGENKSTSMQAANQTRFASHILSPADDLELTAGKERRQVGHAVEGVLFGQTTPMKPRFSSTATGRFDHNASQITFDYYTEPKDK